jgi:phospholipid-binding lipoprotein MlaA
MFNNRLLITLLCIVSLISLTGCATQANKDPLESINRGVYQFNDVADKALIKPIATVYSKVAPSPIKKGVSNFFANIYSLTTVLNDLLQLKFADAFTDAGRFVINSTFGLAGLIDVAAMDNIPRHTEDFGQTLGHWGVGSGAYLVLPLIGPSSTRDFAGAIVDGSTSDPVNYMNNIGQIRTSNQIRATQIISVRSSLLNASSLIDDASLDPYAFMRDAYLQRRESQVNDGASSRAAPQDDTFEYDDYGSEFEE